MGEIVRKQTLLRATKCRKLQRAIIAHDHVGRLIAVSKEDNCAKSHFDIYSVKLSLTQRHCSRNEKWKIALRQFLKVLKIGILNRGLINIYCKSQ